MGQSRLRRRTIAASVTVAVVLVALGGWRVERGARVKCAVPTDRLAAIWSGHDDSRRRSIHEVFTATGRGSAETAWRRVSAALDEYTSQWSRMYVQTCEATNVRGEQSSDVLDLRMSCLQDNLDQVRALTDVLGTANGATGGRAMSAVLDLPAISRCGDLSLLRSAVPLPRDQHTLEAVQSLRKSLREAQALRDLGNFHGARARAVALRSRAEATGYGPLLGEVLELMGSMAMGLEPHDVEKTLHEALFTALAARDDPTAARAASGLIDVVGQHLLRPEEATMWFHLTVAILDRLGPGHERTRAWALNNYAGALMTKGDFESAAALARQAVSLKENALGKDHPDVAISLSNLANALICLGRPAEALPFAERALEIGIKNGDQDSDAVMPSYGTKGNTLVELGRAAESEAAFQAQLDLVEQQHIRMTDRARSYPLEGLGEAKLAQGRPASAIPFLEEALRIREATDRSRVLVAETASIWHARCGTAGAIERAPCVSRRQHAELHLRPFPV